MSFEARFDRIMQLAGALPALKDRFMALAAQDLKFTVRDTAHEVDLTVDRLHLFAQARETLANRRPLGGPGSWVSLMLSYNGSAWLNTVIASCYLVGNRVLVKFSSKGSHLQALMESLYRPIFGDDIIFYRGRGQSFMEESLANPEIVRGGGLRLRRPHPAVPGRL